MINEVAEGPIRSATQLILSQSSDKKALQVGGNKNPHYEARPLLTYTTVLWPAQNKKNVKVL
jgi:hypothetical protein